VKGRQASRSFAEDIR